MSSLSFPSAGPERDQWIVSRRGPRAPLDPWRAYAALRENEPTADGQSATVHTVFLTNRECPWRCLMCDLWRHTLETSVEPGMIPAQIENALASWASSGTAPGRPAVLKLYNSGSFFDPLAIPEADYPAIAALARPYDRVVVESHPALVNRRVGHFMEHLQRDTVAPPALEVAMGLETVHPEVLERLNKRMTVEHFRQAARRLADFGADLRVFLLVQPPFMNPADAFQWAQRSVDEAFDCGATVVSLIPTRAGNGAMDVLRQAGLFTPPTLGELERAVDYGLELKRGRVFADLWDLERFSDCPSCFPARRERLLRMNLAQRTCIHVSCEQCGGSA